jgi:hypothetical protein
LWTALDAVAQDVRDARIRDPGELLPGVPDQPDERLVAMRCAIQLLL